MLLEHHVVSNVVYLCVCEAGYEDNYSQAGPGYNSQAGNHGGSAYPGYGSGPHGANRGGTI